MYYGEMNAIIFLFSKSELTHTVEFIGPDGQEGVSGEIQISTWSQK